MSILKYRNNSTDTWKSIQVLKGDKGDKGNTGDAGVSPTIQTSKVNKITTIKITDATGDHYAYINDGVDGQGAGDMLKSTYDTNDNGIVDNAEKVNNHTVEKDVPSNAIFTDTTYTAGTGISIDNGVITNTGVNDKFTVHVTCNSDEGQSITITESAQDIISKVEKLEFDVTYLDKSIKTNDYYVMQSTSEFISVVTNILIGDVNISVFIGAMGEVTTGVWSTYTLPSKTSDLTNDSGFLTEHQDISGKQDTLVSGTNIKTVNNTTLLGSGNITTASLTGSYTTSTSSSKGYTCEYINTALNSKADSSSIPTKTSDLTNDSNFIDNTYHDSTKQDTLVSGTNIKTINNTDILGEGNIDIAGGSDWTYLGNSTGQYSWIVLPSNWKELLCYIKVGSVSRNLYVHILRDVIQYVDTDSNGNKTFGTSAVALTGSSTSTTVQGGTVAYKVSTNSISVNYVPGYTGVSTIYVYYK